jgi:heme/copper-type cytochrome/quinol oxidase subunit 1
MSARGKRLALPRAFLRRIAFWLWLVGQHYINNPVELVRDLVMRRRLAHAVKSL